MAYLRAFCGIPNRVVEHVKHIVMKLRRPAKLTGRVVPEVQVERYSLVLLGSERHNREVSREYVALHVKRLESVAHVFDFIQTVAPYFKRIRRNYSAFRGKINVVLSCGIQAVRASLRILIPYVKSISHSIKAENHPAVFRAVFCEMCGGGLTLFAVDISQRKNCKAASDSVLVGRVYRVIAVVESPDRLKVSYRHTSEFCRCFYSRRNKRVVEITEITVAVSVNPRIYQRGYHHKVISRREQLRIHAVVQSETIGVESSVVLAPAFVLALVPYNSAELHAEQWSDFVVVLRTGLLKVEVSRSVPLFMHGIYAVSLEFFADNCVLVYVFA